MKTTAIGIFITATLAISSISGDDPSFCSDDAVGFYANPGDCEKYYQCANGQTYIMSCPSGLHFDPAINGCNWPNGNCQEATATPTTVATSMTTAGENACEPDSYEAVAGNCGQFKQCLSSGEYQLMDCAAGLHFDTATNTCENAVDAGCVWQDLFHVLKDLGMLWPAASANGMTVIELLEETNIDPASYVGIPAP